MDKENYIKQLKLFGKISIAEGMSFLLLLGIAMPLKYIYDMPLAVKYFGWIHGLLFMAYAFQLAYIGFSSQWKIIRMLGYFLAALLPFAPFYVDKQLRKEVSALDSTQA